MCICIRSWASQTRVCLLITIKWICSCISFYDTDDCRMCTQQYTTLGQMSDLHHAAERHRVLTSWHWSMKSFFFLLLLLLIQTSRNLRNSPLGRTMSSFLATSTMPSMNFHLKETRTLIYYTVWIIEIIQWRLEENWAKNNNCSFLKSNNR